MKLGTFIILLSSVYLVDVASVQQRLNNVNSLLNLFQGEPRSHLGAKAKPSASIRRKSALVAATVPKAKSNKNCKCQEKVAKRLRREIKDVSFHECKYQGVGIDSEKIIQLSNFTLTPRPLIAPGDLFVNFDIEVRRQLPKDIQIDVDVYKYMFDTLPVNVPCMSVRNTNGSLRLGSCSYKNICQSIETSACDTFKSNGIPCQCENVLRGKYTFRTPLTLRIPNLNTIFDILVKGSYKMRAAFTDSRTKKEFGCIAASWTITKVHRSKERALFFKVRN